MKKTALTIAVLALMGLSFLVFSAPNASAQGDMGGRMPRFNAEEMSKRMAEFRERMLDETGKQLDFSEEEWEAVKPLYTKVTDLQMQVAVSPRRFGRMGRPGRGREGRSEDDNSRRRPNPFSMLTGEEDKEFTQARENLDKVIDAENSSNESIAKALAEFRKAKESVEKKLEAARKELKSVLSVRQEAMLVSSGVLE